MLNARDSLVNTLGGKPVAIVFDLDGTLIDSRSQIGQSIRATRAHLKLTPATDEELVKWFGLHPSSFFPELELEEQQNAISFFRTDLLNSNIPAEPFPEVARALAKFKELGLAMAIATTKPTWLAVHVIAESGLGGYFDHIQGTDDFPPKPEPEVFIRCCRALGLPPSEEIWAIGDRVEDAVGAKTAGLCAIGLVRGDPNPGEGAFLEAGALAVIEKFDQIFTFADW
jgi:phosphoglycolate phosphatase